MDPMGMGIQSDCTIRLSNAPWDGDLLFALCIGGFWYGHDLTQEQVVETAQLLKENHERGDLILIGFC